MCQACTATAPAEYHEEIREYVLPDVPDITPKGMQEIKRQFDRSCDLTQGTLPPSDLTFDRVLGDLLACEDIRNWRESGRCYAIPHPTPYYWVAMQGYWTFDGLSADTVEKRQKNLELRAKLVVRKAQDANAWQYDRFDTSAINWDTIGTDIKNKAGSIGKRVSKEVKRISGHFLPDTIIETINNIADSHRSTDGTPRLNFDQGFVDGEPEDYCNDVSCWWNSYKAGKEPFADAGGYAARLWDTDDNPISRVFIIPQRIQGHSCHILFNDYGDWDLTQWADNLAELWKMERKPIRLGNCSSQMYINANKGYILSPIPLDISRYTLDIQCGERCRDCGEAYDSDDLYWSDSGHGPYCESCIPWTYCERCSGEAWPDDDAIQIDDGHIFCCDDCAEREGYRQCYHCDEWKELDDLSSDCDDELCCSECHSGESCHHCENWIAKGADYVTTQDGDCYCDNCQSEIKQCPHCEEWYESGEDTCPDCEGKPMPVQTDIDAENITSDQFCSPEFICRTAEHPGIVFPEFAAEPLQVRPVESAIDEWNKPEHGRMRNAPMAILAISLCLSGF